MVAQFMFRIVPAGKHQETIPAYDKGKEELMTAQIQLKHRGASFTPHGKIVRSESGKGMAIKFWTLDSTQLAVMKKWLFALNRTDSGEETKS